MDTVIVKDQNRPLLLLARGNDSDTLIAPREEAMEAALVQGAASGTKDVCLVTQDVSFWWGRNTARDDYPNRVWLNKTSHSAPPLDLNIHPGVWTIFRKNLNSEVLGANSAQLFSSRENCVLWGLLCLWNTSLALHLTRTVTFSDWFLVCSCVCFLCFFFFNRRAFVARRKRVISKGHAKVVSRMAMVLEQEGYWITFVDLETWSYIQFTPTGRQNNKRNPGDNHQIFVLRDQGELPQQHRVCMGSPYDPQTWAPLEGSWKMVGKSPAYISGESCITGKVTSDTFCFMGTHDEDTVTCRRATSTCELGCIRDQMEVVGRREGNTFKIQLVMGTTIYPVAKKEDGGAAATYYHCDVMFFMCFKAIMRVEGNTMKLFTFPYLDCPPDDAIMKSGLDEDYFDHWRLYERFF